MKDRKDYTQDELRFINLLAKQYPTVQAASTEIINLQAIMNLPKGTEHFISDVHGEYESFYHILHSCSGVIKEKIDTLYGTSMTNAEREEFATLIYYPEKKLDQIRKNRDNIEEWYRITLYRLISLCRLICSKYTRSKVRKALPEDYGYVINELLHTDIDQVNQQAYYDNIINTIISIDQAPNFIASVCYTIKRMAVDRLHIVGDIFDRGPRADFIIDDLMKYHSVDIQWGNHDILWMGAASGSRTMVATVISNAIHYNNLKCIETGYGISLRPLSVFANEFYSDCDLHRFHVTLTDDDNGRVTEKDKLLSARMYKAITIILFKLEGQKIKNHPEFGMDDRLLLDKIDYENKCITINGITYHLEDCDFPTVDPADPYTLTPEEHEVINALVDSFTHSDKLKQHIRYIYTNGGIYKVHNNNLLLHGCVPMNEDGSFMVFNIGGKERSGKELFDYFERAARKAFYDKENTLEKQFGMDILWFLWGGRNSPTFGRSHLTTFERRLIKDEDAWKEPKNAYYELYQNPEICEKILEEFGIGGPHSHIVNGHVPVRTKKGESPIKGGGKLIVIDGGFCKAYQKTSGIAGYTLIYNSHCIRIVSHHPFCGRKEAIEKNIDIANDTNVFELMESRVKIAQTDSGRQIQSQVDALKLLLDAYRSGIVAEVH